MWKRKLVWKNDSIEFTFQDQILSLEESIQDDKMRFKASMKKGNQVKEVELRMTLKTVPEEINNLVKTEKQEYYEYEQQGSLKDPIMLEKDSNELTDSHRIECELEDTASSIRQDNEKKDNVADAIDDFKTPDANKKRKKSAFEVDLQTYGTPSGGATSTTALGKNSVTITRKLAAGQAKLGVPPPPPVGVPLSPPVGVTQSPPVGVPLSPPVDVHQLPPPVGVHHLPPPVGVPLSLPVGAHHLPPPVGVQHLPPPVGVPLSPPCGVNPPLKKVKKTVPGPVATKVNTAKVKMNSKFEVASSPNSHHLTGSRVMPSPGQGAIKRGPAQLSVPVTAGSEASPVPGEKRPKGKGKVSNAPD